MFYYITKNKFILTLIRLFCDYVFFDKTIRHSGAMITAIEVVTYGQRY